MTSQTLTGYDAIEYAETNGVTLNKYADPTEGARAGLTIAEARTIAAEDPSLIWCVEGDQYAGYAPDGQYPDDYERDHGTDLGPDQWTQA